MKLLFINVDRVYKKIGSCYLLEPNRAKYYFGLKKQLRIDADHILKSVPLSMNLEGKSIFVGQPLYLMNNMRIYSFSSSVLFTTKLINHKTETFAVTHPKVDTIKSDNMIYDYVNGFVSVN